MGSLSLNSPVRPAQSSIERTTRGLVVVGRRSCPRCGRPGLRGRALLPLFGVVVLSIRSPWPDWSLGIAPDERAMASPIQFLWDIPWVRYLRFPGRIMWAGMLCISALAAFGVSRLASRLGTRSAVLLSVVLIVELFATVRLPARQVVRSADVPGVYQIAEGAVSISSGRTQ